METIGQITFDGDAAGYVSQACPACRHNFKVRDADQITTCPYCGHAGDAWPTDEQRAIADAFMERWMAESVNQGLQTLQGWAADPLPEMPPAPVETMAEQPYTKLGTCRP